MSYNPLTTDLFLFASELHKLHEEVVRAAFAVAAGSKNEAGVARGKMDNVARELRGIERNTHFIQAMTVMKYMGEE